MSKYVARAARPVAGKAKEPIRRMAALACAAALAACAPGGSLGLNFADGGVSASYRPRPGAYGQFPPDYYQPQVGLGAPLQADYGGQASGGFYPAQPGYDGQTPFVYDQKQTGFGPRSPVGGDPVQPWYGAPLPPTPGGQLIPMGLPTPGGVGSPTAVPRPTWPTSSPLGPSRYPANGPPALGGW